MPKPCGPSGRKNLIADKLKALRAERHISQRKLADEFQLQGLDIDKNVITRIETQQRFVTDIEILAIMKIFQISFEELVELGYKKGAVQGMDLERPEMETGLSNDNPVL